MFPNEEENGSRRDAAEKERRTNSSHAIIVDVVHTTRCSIRPEGDERFGAFVLRKLSEEGSVTLNAVKPDLELEQTIHRGFLNK